MNAVKMTRKQLEALPTPRLLSAFRSVRKQRHRAEFLDDGPHTFTDVFGTLEELCARNDEERLIEQAKKIAALNTQCGLLKELCDGRKHVKKTA